MISDHKVAGPAWWSRQQNETGITYSDSSLVENFANSNHSAEFYNVPSTQQISPEEFEVTKFGLMTSSMRDQHVRAYENHNKISQANWGSFFLSGNSK